MFIKFVNPKDQTKRQVKRNPTTYEEFYKLAQTIWGPQLEGSRVGYLDVDNELVEIID